MQRSVLMKAARAFLRLGFALALASVPACAGDEEFSTNIAGSYTIALTNAASSCSFEWAEGETSMGVPFTITQDGTSVSGTVGGVQGVWLGIVLGTATFTGSVGGNDFTMTAHGLNSQRQGNCTYTFDATINGSIAGSSIEGTVTYAPNTNDNVDCDPLRCSAEQLFAGSRPPM